MDGDGPSLAERCAAGVRAARALGECRNYRGAIASLGQVLREAPDHVEAHYLLGFYLHNLGRHRDAVEACRAAVGLAPENAVAHRILGVALGAAVSTKVAGLRHLDEAVRLAPTDGFNHFSRARALAGLGRTRQAEAAFRTACEHAPAEPAILTGTAEFLFALRRRREASDLAARAFAAAPDDIGALTAEARSRLLKGRTAEARDLARAAVALNATHRGALALLIETEMCRNPAFAAWSRLKNWCAGGRLRGALLLVLACHFASFAAMAAAVLSPDRPEPPLLVAAALLALPAWLGIVHRRRLAPALRPARLGAGF